MKMKVKTLVLWKKSGSCIYRFIHDLKDKKID